MPPLPFQARSALRDTLSQLADHVLAVQHLVDHSLDSHLTELADHLAVMGNLIERQELQVRALRLADDERVTPRDRGRRNPPASQRRQEERDE